MTALVAVAGCSPCALRAHWRGTHPATAAGQTAAIPAVQTAEEFREHVLDADARVVAHFYLTWCGSCKAMSPTVRRLAAEYAGKVAFVDVDIDKAAGLARKWQIILAPTLLFFARGELVRRVVGVRSESAVRSALEQPWVATATAVSLPEASPPKLPISRWRLRRRIRAAFASLGGALLTCRTVAFDDGSSVYEGTLATADSQRRFFARVASRRPLCSSCHAVHFAYIFDTAGVIVDLVPIQLPKHGNRKFSDADIERLKAGVVGRSLAEELDADPKVDAVTGATVTCAIVFSCLDEGWRVLERLREAGHIARSNGSKETPHG